MTEYGIGFYDQKDAHRWWWCKALGNSGRYKTCDINEAYAFRERWWASNEDVMVVNSIDHHKMFVDNGWEEVYYEA